MSLKRISFFALAALALSCSKEIVETPPTAKKVSPPMSSYDYLDGVVSLDQFEIDVVLAEDTIPVVVYEALGYFIAADKSDFIEGGEVMMDSIRLKYGSDKLHSKNGGEFPLTYNVGSSIRWKIKGKDFPDFDQSVSVNDQLPSIAELPETHSVARPFRVNLNEIATGADSVMIEVYNDSNSVYIKGDTTLLYHSFPAYLLQKFVNTEATVEVSFISQRNRTVKEKTVALMHRRVYREAIDFVK